jgi:osmotically-inducible protein OsmY
MRTDTELQKHVMEEIKFDPLLAPIASSIGVAAKHGVVTLSGEVETFIQKHALEDAAKRVRGVSFVAVDIEVKIGARTRKSDSEIATHIKNAMSRLSIIDKALLDVKVDNGWVTLEGMVRWNYQRVAAEEYVRNLEGVTGITNIITIKDEPYDVQAIAEKINETFHRYATLDASNVHVEVHDRRAVLTGEVRSWIEKKDAEAAVWSSPGITAIDNQLRVNSSGYVQ